MKVSWNALFNESDASFTNSTEQNLPNKSHKFFEKYFTVLKTKAKLQQLFATFFEEYFTVLKTKAKLQQLFVEGKLKKLLKDNLQPKLKRCNFKINEEEKETISSLMERYVNTLMSGCNNRSYVIK